MAFWDGNYPGFLRLIKGGTSLALILNARSAIVCNGWGYGWMDGGYVMFIFLFLQQFATVDGSTFTYYVAILLFGYYHCYQIIMKTTTMSVYNLEFWNTVTFQKTLKWENLLSSIVL